MRWMWLLLYLGVLGYGLGFTFSPMWSSGFRRLQTDPGDTVLNHYFLEHSFRWATQRDYVGTLWSPPFFAPQRDVLGYSDNLFGTAPIYWLLRAFADDVLAYQLWMIVGFALNFLVAALVLRWFGLLHPLCVLGAFLFAFGTPHVQQLGHQQLIYRCGTPFAIWYTYRFLQAPSSNVWLRALFSISWQFVAGVYVGWFVGFGVACWAVILLCLDRETRLRVGRWIRSHPVGTAWPILLNGLLVSLIVIPYLRANQGYHRTFGEVLNGAPRWNSWLSVPPGTWWSGMLEWVNPPEGGEHYLFGGVTCLVFVVLMVVAIRRIESVADRRLILSCGIACVAFVVVSFSIWTAPDYAGTMWFGIYHVVPGGKAIRVPARIYLILYPLLIVAGLLALQHLYLMSKNHRGRFRWGIGALLLLALVENYFPQVNDRQRSFEPASHYARARALAESIRGADVAYGIRAREVYNYVHELEMMWAGLYANVPVANGYSGRSPDGYPLLGDSFSLDTLQQWLGPRTKGTVVVLENADPIRVRRWSISPHGGWTQLE